MSNDKDSLGNRMKSFYEDPYRITLPGRMPVILRLDGSHFSTYTRGCKKPFDENVNRCMLETAIYLCDNIQNAVLAYHQSDELSILLVNYKDLATQSWLNNNLVKMCSTAAGMASAMFSSLSSKIFGEIKLANFDCRGFVLPQEEVNNAFLWRQNDATRNSIQGLAQSMFSQKQLHQKNTSEMQEMIFQKSGQNWNDLPIPQKRGTCVVREYYEKDEITRSRWAVDEKIPIFSKYPEYINRFVYLDKDKV